MLWQEFKYLLPGFRVSGSLPLTHPFSALGNSVFLTCKQSRLFGWIWHIPPPLFFCHSKQEANAIIMVHYVGSVFTPRSHIVCFTKILNPMASHCPEEQPHLMPSWEGLFQPEFFLHPIRHHQRMMRLASLGSCMVLDISWGLVHYCQLSPTLHQNRVPVD